MEPVFARWRALNARTRMLAAGLVAASIAAIALGVWIQRDVRVELFATPIAADQVDEVVRQLAAWRVGFVPELDNVRVDARERNTLLLRLSVTGVPHRHLADLDEALEKIGPLTPQSVLDARKLDALGDELAQGLRGLAGVDDARVIVAPASESSFADEPSHPATASVRLRLRSGATLVAEEVEGIRRFVAAGVSGLDPRAVAVIDDGGVALSETSASGPDAALVRQLQSALDASVGNGATIVRVHVDRDLRTVDRSEVRHATSGAAMARAPGAGDGDRVEDRAHLPPGSVTRISVAVLVDARRGLNRTAIAKIAGATLGLNARRGDVVSVEAVTFGSSSAGQFSRRGWVIGLVLTYAPELLIVGTIIFGVIRGARPIATAIESAFTRFEVSRTSREVAGYPPSVVRGALNGEPPHTAAAIISALPTATATAVLELYPPEERAAIVRRMARATAPVVPDWQSVVRRA